MKVVIIGAGEVGSELAESIRRKGHDVIVVDKSEKACKKVRYLDVEVVMGSGASPELLNSFDIQPSDHFFAVTNDNEINIVACSIAKSFGCKTMARIHGLKYTSQPVSTRLSDIGVDYAVSPELLTARRIANIITVPAAVNKNLFMDGKINVIEFKVPPKSGITGKRIADMELPANVNLGTIVRENSVLVPHGDSVIKEGDSIIAMMVGKEAEREMTKLVGKRRQKVGRLMITGASDIGIHVAKILQTRGIEVRLLDDSKERARRAAEKLKHVKVIVADARDKGELLEEGIEKTNVLAATYKSEEFNVLVSLLAKAYGVEKTIAVVRKLGLRSLIETVGIDMAASPELQTVETMLILARELSSLKAVPIHKGDLYILEMEVTEKSKLLGKRINECDMPEQSLVGAILREGQTVIPRGHVRFMKDDRVLFFVLKEEIENVEELFK